MSHKATNWAVGLRGIKPIAKILLWHLADRHNPDSGCFPDQATLARDCEISRGSVNRHLIDLEDAGLVKRVPRVDPVTRRQLSTRYFLAFEDGFEALPVVARVSALNTEIEASRVSETGGSRVSESADPVCQSCGTLTCKGTCKDLTKKAPLPPEGGLQFAVLWEAYPESHRGRRDNAEGAFNRLSVAEAASAISAAGGAVKALAARHERVPALAAYIRNRVFLEFDGAPDVDSDGYFVVKPGRPEWGPWLGWVRRTYSDKRVQDVVMRGFFLTKTRWPEGHGSAPAKATETAGDEREA